MRFLYRSILCITVYLAAMLVGCSVHKPQTDRMPVGHADQVVVILGDSNIWLAGDSCNNHKGWTAWFNDIWQPASCLSYARSGASWSNTADTKKDTKENIAVLGDNNVIYNQVTRLEEAYDAGLQARPTLIIVSAGGNDAWFAEKRPGEFDLTVDEAFAEPEATLLASHPSQVLSLAGAVRQGCLRLSKKFPEARIVLLTPPQMVKADPELQARVSDVIDACGWKLGVQVIRLDGPEPISREVEMHEHVNTYDGVHTNETGAQTVAEYIIKRL